MSWSPDGQAVIYILGKCVQTVDIRSTRVDNIACFEAAVQFSRCEGIIPAPESSHAIRGAIDEALRAKVSRNCGKTASSAGSSPVESATTVTPARTAITKCARLAVTAAAAMTNASMSACSAPNSTARSSSRALSICPRCPDMPSTRWMRISGYCLCIACSSGTPAFIIVASCRVNVVRILGLTFPRRGASVPKFLKEMQGHLMAGRIDDAIKASVALAKLTGIAFTTCPAVEVEILVRKKGFAPMVLPALRIPPASGPADKGPADLGLFVLRPGVRLAGRVVDPEAGRERFEQLGLSLRCGARRTRWTKPPTTWAAASWCSY